LASGDVVIAVDHKPKTTRRLQRIVNVEANPGVSLLAEHWNEDWRHLWWVRVDGTAAVLETDEAAIDALVTKYEQYREHRPDGPVIKIRVDSVTGWSAR
jgi:PPOX class probable F420-dependent enzyme